MERDDLKKTMIRIPLELHEQLKILADKDKRSLNNYIVMLLENHVKNTEKEKSSN